MDRTLPQKASRASRRVLIVLAAVGSALALTANAFARTDASLVKVSKDPYTNTSSYHKTEVEPDTFTFGSTIVSSFQVGRFTDGGASNIGFATSTDNGVTWKHGFLPKTTVFSDPPGPWDRLSDTAVSYDPKHDVWMIESLTLLAGNAEAVIVSRSVDGGLTWKAPVTAADPGSSIDKSWIGCDTWSQSPDYGNCYVEYDDTGSGDLMQMYRSTDGGKTWSASSVPGAFGLGGQPVTQPNGTVVVPYLGNGIQALVSTDGGKTYSVFSVASQTDHEPAGGIRAEFPLPSAEVDGSGIVYVVWHDCRFRSGCPANDIVMSTSSNGKNWSNVVRIPIDGTNSGVDHFIPGIGVDTATQGSSAHLAVTYYFYPHTNCDVSTCKLEAGFVSSTDGGSTWSSPKTLAGPMKLTALPNTTLGYMVGDYISTSILGNGKADTVVAVANKGTCTLGNITSCKEFMMAPAGGLTVAPGTIPARPDRVASFHSDHPTRTHPIAQ